MKKVVINVPDDCEVWKDIDGYEGIYQVSNKGNIKTLEHKSECKSYISDNKIVPSFSKKVLENITKGYLTKNGYRQIRLCKDGTKTKFYIHRLVAKAFIDNPNNYEFVNHKDENKENNCVENLEWCTKSYNCLYSNNHMRANENTKIIIKQYDLNNNYITSYNSISEASRATNISKSSIIKCYKGRAKTAGKYIWKKYLVLSVLPKYGSILNLIL